MDIQVAGGVAPGARIAVYFAPNTDQGFVDPVSTAAHDTINKPDVISISWGSGEINWANQAIQAMNNALQDAATLNVSIFVASGDALANDGKVHVDYPHRAHGRLDAVVRQSIPPATRLTAKLCGTTVPAEPAAASATCFQCLLSNKGPICRLTSALAGLGALK